MSTIDWPASITPAAAQWALQKSGVQFASPFNGTVQALDYLAERWAVSLSLPNARNHGAVAALMNTLAGGVNRVNLWHHGSGGQPAGTLRGAPVLGSAAARGDAALTLGNCLGKNLVLNGSFETDSNADNLADGWTLFVGGAGDSGRTYTLSRVPTVGARNGSATQFVQNLSVGNANDTGIVRAPRPAIVPGVQYTLSAAIRAGISGQVILSARIYNGSGGVLGDYSTSTVDATGALVDRAVTFVAPAGAQSADIVIRGASGAGAYFEADVVQLEVGASATNYAGPATLLAGDMIGCSGHLFQVASDCTANDAGVMTVPVINRVRGTIASGTAVTWYRPTAQFILPAMSAGAMQVPGYTQGPALDLLEVY